MEIFSALAALFFVLALLGIFAWGVKRSGLMPGQARGKTGVKQLEIIESKMVDGRNRLVVVSWRGKQFLLGTNPGGMRLISSDLLNETDDNAEFKKLVGDNENK